MSKDLGDLYDRLSQIHDVDKLQLAAQAQALVELRQIRVASERAAASADAVAIAVRTSLGILNAQAALLKKIEKNTRQPEIGAVKATVQLSEPIANEEN